MIFTIPFWKAVLERALKTLAQTAAALLIASSTGLIDTEWVGLISAAGMAALVSVLTSVGTGLATDGGPSLGNVEKVAPAPAAPERAAAADTS